jgi:tetratricopeptide (TPR) repeat protein
MFKGRNHDHRAVGEKLNVATVLEGSVRRAGNRVRITAQLINVNDGYHLWSERFDRELTDIFAIQDEIATAISSRLAVTLRGGEVSSLVKPSTSSIEAYEHYLKARSLMKERGAALLVAIAHLEHAIAFDPDFAPALAYLAHALVLASFWGQSSPDKVTSRARWAASAALERHATLVAAHTASALVATCIDFDSARATDAWNRALEIDPNDNEARVMRAAFDLCYTRGDFETAVSEVRRVIDNDPLSAIAHAQLSVILSFAGRFDEALDVAKHARKLDKTSFFAVWSEVNTLAFGGSATDALDLLPKLLPRYGRHPWLMMAHAAAYDRAGKPEPADAVYTELNARAMTEYVQPAVLAIAAEHAGRRREALSHLRTAVEVRDAVLGAFALLSPPMAKLRTAPEFAEIVAPLGARPNAAPEPPQFVLQPLADPPVVDMSARI